jgi:hypothetical protein
MSFYLKRNGKISGPHSADTIKQGMAAGRLKASDVVSKTKDGPWRPLKKKTAEPHNVFLSHSSKDKEVADAVCATLEGRGIRCWVAPRDIPAGANWGESIIDGITVTKVMVVILSSDSNESSQVMREVERAVNKDSAIIPFKIKDIPLSKSLEYFLSTAHWLDASTPRLCPKRCPLENVT